MFADPLALRILGADAEAIARDAESSPARRAMRLFIAARSRFAEDSLAVAAAHGARQLVVLGAGLDTYAYRSPLGDALHVFEVDHPATQAWKRLRLAEAGIAIPSALTFAPIDLERETLPAGLAAAGFDPAQRSFFTWLGVVLYLTEEAVFSTLAFIGSLRGGAQVVFDYPNPPASLSRAMRAVHDRRAAHVATLGEAWITYFETDALHARLEALGFSVIEDLGPVQIASRYLPDRTGPFPDRGGHVVRAATF